jgi:hypothetical protein
MACALGITHGRLGLRTGFVPSPKQPRAQFFYGEPPLPRSARARPN